MKKHEVELDFETAKLNKNQVTMFLMGIAKKRYLINKEQKKFASNAFFRSIYTKETLMSIMNETLSKVVNAHEAYVIKKQEEHSLNKSTKSQLINKILKSKNIILDKAFNWIEDEDLEDDDHLEDGGFEVVKKIKKTDLLKNLELMLNSNEYSEEVFPEFLEAYKEIIKSKMNKKDLNKLKKDELISVIVNYHIPNYAPTISDNLDLSTLGYITGYFINAFSNNISKDYKKYTASKREGELVSYDVDGEASTDDQKETIMVFNQVSEDSIESLIQEKEFKQSFYTIIKGLKKYDKKVNEINKTKYSGEIPESKKSFLAYLFLYLINPKYKGKYVYIKEKLDISQYIFNAKKEEIVDFIKKYYPEEAAEIYKYISDNYKTYGENLRPKKTQNYYDQSCTVKDSFEVQFLNKRLVNVIYKVNMVRLNNGRWEELETKTFEKRTFKTHIDDTKDFLKTEASTFIKELKNKAEGKRIEAVKEIYAA